MQYPPSSRYVRAFVLALFIGSLSSGHALTKEQILEIAAKPHSVENLHPGLAMIPHAPEYTIKLELTLLERNQNTTMELKVKEKIVGGRYIVTQFKPKGAPAEMIIVTTFHPPTGLYLKTTLEPDGNIQDSVGTSTPGSHAISWRSVGHAPNQPSIFTLEQHAPNRTTWTEITMLKDTPKLRTRGIALKQAPAKPAAAK
jgi:hypothetical protein